jgi:hypothetical protein
MDHRHGHSEPHSGSERPFHRNSRETLFSEHKSGVPTIVQPGVSCGLVIADTYADRSITDGTRPRHGRLIGEKRE